MLLLNARFHSSMLHIAYMTNPPLYRLQGFARNWLDAMAGHNYLETLSFDYNPEYGEGTGQNLGGLR